MNLPQLPSMLNRKSSVIRTRVMQHIHERIDKAQAECDAEHTRLQQVHDAKVEEMTGKLWQDKQDVVDRAVEAIIGKIL